MWDCPVCGIRRDPLGGEVWEVNMCARGQQHWEWDIQLWKRTGKDKEYGTYLRCCFCENCVEKCRPCNKRKNALLASLQEAVEAAVEADDFPRAIRAWEDSARDVSSRADRNRMLLQLAKVAVACSSGISWLETNSDKLALVTRKTTLDASKPWLRCLRQVSDSIGNLTGLIVTLNLSGNAYLERLPIRVLCNLRSLKGLDVKSCPKLLSPPPQICAQPPEQTLKFLRDAMAGGRLHEGCIVLVIGPSGGGKTSVINAITQRVKQQKTFNFSAVPGLDVAGIGMKRKVWSEPTVGVVATKWAAEGDRGTSLLFVELGGHEAFLDAYRSFLSRRAIYLLCWDASVEAEADRAAQLAMVSHWLAILQNRVPGVPVLLVATHASMVSAASLGAACERVRVAAAEQMQQLVHPEGPRSIELLDGGASAAVDCVAEMGVDKLRNRVHSQVRRTRWYEEAVPREFEKLEAHVRRKAETSPCISREEFHELCSSAGIHRDLYEWATRWLHDSLEIRDLGTDVIWVSVPWAAVVVNEALRPKREKLREFIRNARNAREPWADEMEGQVMGRLHRRLFPFVWDARSEAEEEEGGGKGRRPSPAAFWEASSAVNVSSINGGGAQGQQGLGGGLGGLVDLATHGRRGSKWSVAQAGMRQGSLMQLQLLEQMKASDAWVSGAKLMRSDPRAFRHAETLLQHMHLLSASGPWELAGPMLGGQYRRLVIEAGALSLSDCLLWARYRFLVVPPGFLRAVVVRLQAKTLQCETNMMGAALYTDGRMLQIFEGADGKSITVRTATEIGLEIAAKEVEETLDLFPGVVLLGKDSGPKDVVLPAQMLIVTTAAVGWKQFKEEVTRPRMRDDILSEFWDNSTGGGTGVRNTLCRLIMQESGGSGVNRQELDVELFGKFVRFTGPARVYVLLLSGDVGAAFQADAELRRRLAQAKEDGGRIVAVWLPDCRVEDHMEWWPPGMEGVLGWDTPYVDARNKATWGERVREELLPLVYKLLKLWRGSPGAHGRMVKCPTCRPLGLVTGQYSLAALEAEVAEWLLRSSQGEELAEPSQRCRRGHEHETVDILQGEGGSASHRCDAVPCPHCVAEGAVPPGSFDLWQTVAPYFRGEAGPSVDGRGLARCSRCGVRSRVLEVTAPHVFVAFAGGSRPQQMEKLARQLLRRLEEEAGTVNCLGGVELAGAKALEGVRRSTMALLLLTDDFPVSRACAGELAEALRLGKAVVPVLLRPQRQAATLLRRKSTALWQQLRRQGSVLAQQGLQAEWAGWSGAGDAGETWPKHALEMLGGKVSAHGEGGGEASSQATHRSGMGSQQPATMDRQGSAGSDAPGLTRPWKLLGERGVEALELHVGMDGAAGAVSVDEGECRDVVSAVVDTLLSAPWPELPHKRAFGSPLPARSALSSASGDVDKQSSTIASPLRSPLETMRARRVLSERTESQAGSALPSARILDAGTALRT